MPLFSLIQQIDVNEKIKNTPDNGYAIGVWIGTVLPFALIVGVAFWMYHRAKNRRNEQ